MRRGIDLLAFELKKYVSVCYRYVDNKNGALNLVLNLAKRDNITSFSPLVMSLYCNLIPLVIKKNLHRSDLSIMPIPEQTHPRETYLTKTKVSSSVYKLE